MGNCKFLFDKIVVLIHKQMKSAFEFFKNFFRSLTNAYKLAFALRQSLIRLDDTEDRLEFYPS